QHYDILKFATPPEMKCAQCKSPTTCVAPENLLSRLRTLPPVEIEPGLRKFIKEMRDRKPAVQQIKKEAGKGGPRVGMFSALIGVAAVAALVVVAVNWAQQRETQTKFAEALVEVKKS